MAYSCPTASGAGPPDQQEKKPDPAARDRLAGVPLLANAWDRRPPFLDQDHTKVEEGQRLLVSASILRAKVKKTAVVTKNFSTANEVDLPGLQSEGTLYDTTDQEDELSESDKESDDGGICVTGNITPYIKYLPKETRGPRNGKSKMDLEATVEIGMARISRAKFARSG